MKDYPTKAICFFNSNRAWGGGEKWHFASAKELKHQGFKTILVTNNSSELKKKGISQHLDVYSFSISNLSFLNPLKILTLFFFFKTQKVDTIILNLPADLKSGGVAARLAGVKKIIYRRGMPHSLRNTWLNRTLFTKVLTDVIVNSEEIGRSLVVGNEAWFPKEKLTLIYNGIDTKLPILKNKKIYHAEAGVTVIGNAGRLTHQKGQEHLIEVAKFLRTKDVKFHLLIAGEGELRSKLQQMINDNNLTHLITLLGHVDDMPAFMNSIDIFVFPSLFEGSANTLIETLYFQKPVVAFDVSSNPEIIQHGVNGYLAKAFDSQNLSEHVFKLMKSPQLREEFIANGKKIVHEKFDNKKIVEKLLAII